MWRPGRAGACPLGTIRRQRRGAERVVPSGRGASADGFIPGFDEHEPSDGALADQRSSLPIPPAKSHSDLGGSRVLICICPGSS